MEWVEQSCRPGDTVKIIWAEWYAKLIGRQSTIGVCVPGGANKIAIDIGDRLVFLSEYCNIEVWSN